MDLEKIKELRAKGEILKALIELADTEQEQKEHKRALNSVKNELLKMLNNKTANKESQEQKSQKNLADILKENEIKVE